MKLEIMSRYFKKSGDDNIALTNFVENDYGFASYSINSDALIILNCFGDGKYWDHFFTSLAKERNCKKIRFATRRNYKAFERAFGYKQIGYVLEKEVLL